MKKNKEMTSIFHIKSTVNFLSKESESYSNLKSVGIFYAKQNNAILVGQKWEVGN